MSAHNLKTKRAHPNAQREQFQVAHVTVEVSRKAGTFALIAGEAHHSKDRSPMFTGIVEPGMGTALRRLAHAIDEMEAEQSKRART
ncbi:hypothetical protein DL239_20250 [Sedimentitalea sp. CY04]|uniref:Uncharacterized protein n=1 Tax=Parasedimentitalea denitrificans TaxID=2211118 RepID=A0ABX0WDH7_9RHOB|nr:hypothetical protein [Sedimentitalea sp. CY04]NIZ63303.1 hypothetical protein [Sedimentitalea sp. CY04]